ncbi:MAG: LysR family transcriptional regulator [Pseudomonadota bacterium]
MDNIDLRLLVLFDEIYKASSLSKAADRIGLSQPGVSLALERLRKHFNDKLFVRTTNGMEPTLHAKALLPIVRQGIAALQATMAFRFQFVPEDSDRTFHISMTDVGQIVLLPSLLNQLRLLAPNVKIEVSTINKDVPKALESGDLDLAVGFVPQLQNFFYQQVLFEEKFVCLARKAHPRIKDSITLRQYERELHVVVTTSGTGHLVIDKTIDKLEVHRKVGVHIPNFIGLSTIIGATDYICTLPFRAGEIMAHHGEVKLLKVPFEVPSYVVKQHWHERQAQDPGNRWLRQVIAEMYVKARETRRRTQQKSPT